MAAASAFEATNQAICASLYSMPAVHGMPAGRQIRSSTWLLAGMTFFAIKGPSQQRPSGVKGKKNMIKQLFHLCLSPLPPYSNQQTRSNNLFPPAVCCCHIPVVRLARVRIPQCSMDGCRQAFLTECTRYQPSDARWLKNCKAFGAARLPSINYQQKRTLSSWIGYQCIGIRSHA